VKYLILIYGNPESREIWSKLSDEQRSQGWGAYAELTKAVDEAGELIATAPLAEPSEVKRITVTDGKTLTTDGPFAEVKEHLAGFYLLECESLERAVERAAQIPEAAFGLVEVHPTREPGGF